MNAEKMSTKKTKKVNAKNTNANVVAVIFTTGPQGSLVKLGKGKGTNTVIGRMKDQLSSLGISSRRTSKPNDMRELISLIRSTWDSRHPEKIVVLKDGWILSDDLMEELLSYDTPCLFSFSGGFNNCGIILSDDGSNVVGRFTDWARDQATSFNNLILQGHTGHVFRKNLGFHYQLHPSYCPSRFVDINKATPAEARALLGKDKVKPVKVVKEKAVKEDLPQEEAAVEYMVAEDIVDAKEKVANPKPLRMPRIRK